jgi:hypothetical protein
MNFIKKIVGKKQEKDSCCGIEIKEVESQEDSCCSSNNDKDNCCA